MPEYDGWTGDKERLDTNIECRLSRRKKVRTQRRRASATRLRVIESRSQHGER